jgi:predicted nucleic acid-binding protein
LKAYLDANILFTAAYTPKGASGRLILYGRHRGLQCCTSPWPLEEARRNLALKAPNKLANLEMLLHFVAMVPDVIAGAAPTSLPAKDQPVWLSALQSGCTVLVTGDVKDFGGLPPHPQMRVVLPARLFDEVFG